jgi:hypothetical protein
LNGIDAAPGVGGRFGGTGLLSKSEDPTRDVWVSHTWVECKRRRNSRRSDELAAEEALVRACADD